MNVHRRKLTDADLARLIACVDPDWRLLDSKVLAGGSYNTVYRLRVAEQPPLILKLSPDPRGDAMTYESGLVATEGWFNSLAARTATVPVPDVVAVLDLGADFGGGHALLTTQLPGRPWHQVPPPVSERPALRRALGRLTAELHAVTGEAFGYPSLSTGPLTPSWRDAFAAMMQAVLNDARRFSVELPVDIDRIETALDAAADDLDSVVTPSLVHFDLWDGNILLDRQQITGLIDGERAMWADPVAEFASLALFGELRVDADFLTGYAEAGGTFDSGDSARRRLLLYRIYLWLIMAVEPVPRGYDLSAYGEMTATVAKHLRADLAEFTSRCGSP